MQLAEGFTFMEHFCRTYPDLFTHKCEYCNGSGCMTCPRCQGYKDKAARSRPRITDLAGNTALIQGTGRQECMHCGDYCNWDDESEWEEK
jgi:hypothetical protein